MNNQKYQILTVNKIYKLESNVQYQSHDYNIEYICANKSRFPRNNIIPRFMSSNGGDYETMNIFKAVWYLLQLKIFSIFKKDSFYFLFKVPDMINIRKFYADENIEIECGSLDFVIINEKLFDNFIKNISYDMLKRYELQRKLSVIENKINKKFDISNYEF